MRSATLTQAPVKLDLSVVVTANAERERPMLAVAELPKEPSYEDGGMVVGRPVQKQVLFERVLRAPVASLVDTGTGVEPLAVESSPEAVPAPKKSSILTRQTLFSGLLQNAYGLGPGDSEARSFILCEGSQEMPGDRSLVVRGKTEVTVFGHDKTYAEKGLASPSASASEPEPQPQRGSGSQPGIESEPEVEPEDLVLLPESPVFTASVLETMLAQARSKKTGFTRRGGAAAPLSVLPATPVFGQSRTTSPEGVATISLNDRFRAIDLSLVGRLGWGTSITVPEGVPWIASVDLDHSSDSQKPKLSRMESPASVSASTPTVSFAHTLVEPILTPSQVAPPVLALSKARPRVEAIPLRDTPVQGPPSPEASVVASPVLALSEEHSFEKSMPVQDAGVETPSISVQGVAVGGPSPPSLASQAAFPALELSEAYSFERSNPSPDDAKESVSLLTMPSVVSPALLSVEHAASEVSTASPSSKTSVVVTVPERALSGDQGGAEGRSQPLTLSPDIPLVRRAETKSQESKEEHPQRPLVTLDVPVQGLGTGVAYALGDAVGLVVGSSKVVATKIASKVKKAKREKKPSKVPVQKNRRKSLSVRTPSELSAYMGGRVVHGIEGVFSGGGMVLRGGKEVFLGTVGCLSSAAGGLAHALRTRR